MNKVLLVIPAYNEEKNIEKVVDRIIRDFPRLDYIVVMTAPATIRRRFAAKTVIIFWISR